MKKTLLTLAVVAMTAGAAQAATSMQTQSFGGVLNDLSILTFNSFNTSLGTLTKVTIDVDVTVTSGTALVDNDGNQPAAADVDAGAKSVVSSGGEVAFGTNITAEALKNALFNLTADDGDGGGIDPSPTDGASLDVSGANGSDTRVVTAAIQLASFTDTISGPDFDIDVDSTSVVNISATGVAGGFTTIEALGDVKITYEYTPIPEPASMALMGLGGLALIRRRR